ncbi:hypothetical protein [Streptomyces sp. MI02-7b]|uniref:hypothetical protein n=1 Tax=Streptomyces sp. MI02-7b TaxID=462941 RepID=UPI0029CA64A8|nr:hypothetical protein [Streptomyces sp. MI02-7b]
MKELSDGEMRSTSLEGAISDRALGSRNDSDLMADQAAGAGAIPEQSPLSAVTSGSVATTVWRSCDNGWITGQHGRVRMCPCRTGRTQRPRGISLSGIECKPK